MDWNSSRGIDSPLLQSILMGEIVRSGQTGISSKFQDLGTRGGFFAGRKDDGDYLQIVKRIFKNKLERRKKGGSILFRQDRFYAKIR